MGIGFGFFLPQEESGIEPLSSLPYIFLCYLAGKLLHLCFSPTGTVLHSSSVSPPPNTIQSPLPSWNVFDCRSLSMNFFFFSVRLLSFFNICFITFPAVVFLSLFFRHLPSLLGFPTQPYTGFSFVYVNLLSFIWATIAFPNMASIINGTNWIKLQPSSKLKHFKTELLFAFFVQHLICTSVTLRNEYSAYAMLPSPTTLNSATISDQLSNVIWIIFLCSVLLSYLLVNAMLEPQCQSALPQASPNRESLPPNQTQRLGV